LLVSCAPGAVDDVLAVFRADGFHEAGIIGAMRPGTPGVRVI